MREVAVIGVGMTPFGKHTGLGIKQLGEQALWEALQDARMKPSDIQVAYCGHASGSLSKQEFTPGQVALREVGITRIPVTRVENACASASSAFREAWIAVASGLYDVALAMGIEKMSEASTEEVMRALAGGSDAELEGSMGVTFPGVFAMIARRHMYQYGTTREQMAMVSVKNHRNGARNPLAHYQKECTVEEVLNSRMIAHPLTLLECSPISDGCAVAILTSRDLAQKHNFSPIWVAASGQASGAWEGKDITIIDPTIRASQQAYEMAGLGPEDIDLVEVHDCFSIAEILHYEDLGFCPKGEGGRLIQEGATKITGRIPFNTSGGLLSKGHPIGATGLAQIFELVQQLRGRAGARQVDGAKVGMAHCLGGFMHSDACSVAVHILKA